MGCIQSPNISKNDNKDNDNELGINPEFENNFQNGVEITEANHSKPKSFIHHSKHSEKSPEPTTPQINVKKSKNMHKLHENMLKTINISTMTKMDVINENKLSQSKHYIENNLEIIISI